ncbi:MAG: HPr family phosphocarrier protein [Pseudomonadota bacterium]
MISTVQIVNERGLHARASAKFVSMVAEFDAKVQVTVNGETVPGDSLLGLLMLAAGPGTEMEIEATGAQENEAMEALSALVANKFGEGR